MNSESRRSSSSFSSSGSSRETSGTGRRTSGAQSKYNQPEAWQGDARSSGQANPKSEGLSSRRSADDQASRSRRSSEFAGSRNTITPLTPAIKVSADEMLRPKQKKPPIGPIGLAYSSPNLKGLNNLTGEEQARLMESFLSGAMSRTNTNYVDPLYRDLNPSMSANKNKPVWSLSQPLPHVLDPALAEKLLQKNMEAKSRASSRSGSREVSRSGSMTSVNDWKRLLRRAASNMKLTDLEAQVPNRNSTEQSQKQTLENPRKPTQSHIEVAGKQEGPGSHSTHNVNFSVGDEGYPPSVPEEKYLAPPNNKSNAAALEDRLSEEERTSMLLDGGDSGGVGNDDGVDEPLAFPNYWAKIRYHMREPFAEFLGTLVLVVFGVGSNLQATVTKGAGGSFESLSFAWGFGCMLGVYVAGGVSGGHINPAVTISMAIFRKFPWKKVPIYIVAQIFGAFFGGALGYGYFWSSINEYEGGPHIRTAASGACLFTNPKSYVTWRNAFFDEFIGTAVLVGCLMALLDDSNSPPTNGMTATIVGFLVAGIGMALGYQTSFTINPARDLGPRIFSAMVGYGPHPFHLTHWWWTWGAWGGPIGGGIAGALVYDLFIFTGCESPINYPDNGYIEHRVNKLLNRKVDSSSMDLDENSNSNTNSLDSIKKAVPT